MTREEAITVLEKESSIIDDNSIEMTAREWDEFDDLKRDAIPVAIEALKARPTEGDIISRADAIEAIASRDETDGTVKVFTGRQVNEILTALPSAQPEWIPVTERLPEEGQMVLTTIRGHDGIIVQDGETREEATERVCNSVIYVSVGFIGSDGWYGADGYPQIVHPVAWMPLPEPYKEDTNAD